MIITYHGAGMIKVSHGEWLAVFNPIGRSADLKPNRFGADLALVAINDPAYNGVSELSYKERQPFVIEGPGEYERAGAFVRGFAAPGPDGRINTIYNLTLDGKHLVHLGRLVEPELTPDLKEEMTPADIIFVPLVDLDPRAAYQLALAFSPAIIIPVHYTAAGLKQFLKEAGEETVKPLEKFAVKGHEFGDKEAEIVLLQPV